MQSFCSDRHFEIEIPNFPEVKLHTPPKKEEEPPAAPIEVITPPKPSGPTLKVPGKATKGKKNVSL
jgi:hypothetical protein